MKPKTLFILVISFIVVMGVYLGLEKLYLPKAEEKKTREEKVFPVAEEDVTGIELISQGEVIILEKDDNAWELTAPIRTAADNGEVASLLSFALDAKIQRNFGDPDEAKVDLAEFGLDEPALTVTLHTEDAESLLIVGGETPEGERRYALIEHDGDETVALIDSLVLTDLDRDTRALRKKDITAFHADDVERFSVTRNGNTVTSERTGGDDWIITEPVEFAADSTEIYDVLDYVTEAEAVNFFDDEAENLSEYGLENPVITLVLTDTEGAASTLIIGDEDENGDYYALWEGMPWIFTVSDKVKNKLTLTEESLMEKILLDYTVADVTDFTLETEHDSFVVSRTEDGWEIEEPEELKGDKTAIDNLLFDFKDLRFDEVVEKPTDNADGYGMNDPRISLSVVYAEDEEGEDEASLIFGEEKDEGAYVRAIRDDADFVAFVTLDDPGALSPTLFDLMDKSLLTFEPDDVERVVIDWEGDSYEIEKKKKKWEMIAPEEADVSVEMMTYLLLGISDLAYYDVMYDTTENLEPFGLDDPVISISLFDAEDAELGEILLGEEDEEHEHYPAVSSDLPMIYSVESDLVEDVYFDILDLQE